MKRSVLTDARGVPLSVVIDGANRNDYKLMSQTLEAIPVERPIPTANTPQNLCLDKGYDYREPQALADEFAFTLHLRTRDEEIQAKCHTRPRRADGSWSAHIPGSTASVPF